MSWVLRLLLFLWSSAGLAHPVTFTGGIAASSVHRPAMTHSQVNYTLHRNLAVGVTHLRYRYLETPLEGSLGQVNALLYRRNRSHSQGNLYLSIGAGAQHDGVEVDGPLFLGGLQADFETDNFYSAIMGTAVGDSQDLQDLSGLTTSLRGRVGVLPFSSGFDSLQAWAVVQVDYLAQHPDPLSVTPLMRFFYRNVLWEFGASMDGHPWLQLMVHL